MGECGVMAVARMVPSDQRQLHKVVEILLVGGGSQLLNHKVSVDRFLSDRPECGCLPAAAETPLLWQ